MEPRRPAEEGYGEASPVSTGTERLSERVDVGSVNVPVSQTQTPPTAGNVSVREPARGSLASMAASLVSSFRSTWMASTTPKQKAEGTQPELGHTGYRDVVSAGYDSDSHVGGLHSPVKTGDGSLGPDVKHKVTIAPGKEFRQPPPTERKTRLQQAVDTERVDVGARGAGYSMSDVDDDAVMAEKLGRLKVAPDQREAKWQPYGAGESPLTQTEGGDAERVYVPLAQNPSVDAFAQPLPRQPDTLPHVDVRQRGREEAMELKNELAAAQRDLDFSARENAILHRKMRGFSALVVKYADDRQKLEATQQQSHDALSRSLVEEQDANRTLRRRLKRLEEAHAQHRLASRAAGYVSYGRDVDFMHEAAASLLGAGADEQDSVFKFFERLAAGEPNLPEAQPERTSRDASTVEPAAPIAHSTRVDEGEAMREHKGPKAANPPKKRKALHKVRKMELDSGSDSGDEEAPSVCSVRSCTLSEADRLVDKKVVEVEHRLQTSIRELRNLVEGLVKAKDVPEKVAHPARPPPEPRSKPTAPPPSPPPQAARASKERVPSVSAYDSRESRAVPPIGVCIDDSNVYERRCITSTGYFIGKRFDGPESQGYGRAVRDTPSLTGPSVVADP